MGSPAHNGRLLPWGTNTRWRTRDEDLLHASWKVLPVWKLRQRLLKFAQTTAPRYKLPESAFHLVVLGSQPHQPETGQTTVRLHETWRAMEGWLGWWFLWLGETELLNFAEYTYFILSFCHNYYLLLSFSVGLLNLLLSEFQETTPTVWRTWCIVEKPWAAR